MRAVSGVVAVCLTALTLAGCSTSAGGDGGSAGGAMGGSFGAGGKAVMGGSGGVPGTGGSSGSSVSGSAGAAATGGSVASGGSSVTGGAGGAGGSVAGMSGTGGSTSSGGVPNLGSGGTSAGSGGRSGASSAGGVSGKGSSGGSGATLGGNGGTGAGNGGSAGAANTCPSAMPLTGGKQFCSNSKGTAGGGNYAYELWSNGTGTGCMTVYGKDATFSATWTNAGDFLARIGLGFDQTKTPSQLGTISSDFAETKSNDAGLVYVGIYGWTVSPLREYYIIDDWGDAKPADTASDGTPRTHVGTIMVDDSPYDVWKHTQTNKPAITGDNQTFDQYFSVRATPRQCGHISISEHFSQWGTLGLDLGKLEEAKLLLEAQDSTGTIAFTTATVVVK